MLVVEWGFGLGAWVVHGGGVHVQTVRVELRVYVLHLETVARLLRRHNLVRIARLVHTS